MPAAAQGAADRVGEQHREHPAPGAEPQRPALDPLEVDLVAGEEEEHAEAEVGEEVDEFVVVGEVEDFRADHDPQHQLEHHDRRREAASARTATVIAASAAATTIAKKDSCRLELAIDGRAASRILRPDRVGSDGGPC